VASAFAYNPNLQLVPGFGPVTYLNSQTFGDGSIVPIPVTGQFTLPSTATYRVTYMVETNGFDLSSGVNVLENGVALPGSQSTANVAGAELVGTVTFNGNAGDIVELANSTLAIMQIPFVSITVDQIS